MYMHVAVAHYPITSDVTLLRCVITAHSLHLMRQRMCLRRQPSWNAAIDDSSCRCIRCGGVASYLVQRGKNNTTILGRIVRVTHE